jgi:hypothetical protein
MAAESCRYMLWQQRLAAGQTRKDDTMARRATVSLAKLDRDYAAYWPKRNKATPAKSSGFLRWRIADYRKRILHFAAEEAKQQ